MERKKINQFVGSLVMFPILTLSVPFSGVDRNDSTQPTAFSEKANTVISGLLAFNQDEAREINEDEALNKAKAEAIDAYFKARNMPLEGFGFKMVEEAEKNELDWRLLPAISVIETTGGKNLCKKLPPDKKFNPFGWGSCKIGFKSFNEAIETVARNLGGNNPKTSHHYEDKETLEILNTYNPPSIVPKYAQKVMKVMENIGPLVLPEVPDSTS